MQSVAGGFLQFLKGNVRVNFSWDTDDINANDERRLFGRLGVECATDARPADNALVQIRAGPYTAYHFYSGTESGAEYLHVCVEVERRKLLAYVTRHAD